MVDTNVLVSALHFGGRPRRLVDEIIAGRHRMVTGVAILDELEAVLIDVCGWEEGPAAAARSEVEAAGEIARPIEVPRVCRDPDDDAVLAIAVAGAADALVTGDGDLLDLKTHHGVRIVTVAEFEAIARAD